MNPPTEAEGRSSGADRADVRSVACSPTGELVGEKREKEAGMAADQKVIGEIAARIMERIEEEYGEEATITGAMLIVGLDHGSESGSESVMWQPSAGMARYEAVGLVEHTKALLLGPIG
jgi:hypothetical protein